MRPEPPATKGQRIELLSMPDDPDPVPVGTQGVVEDATYLSFAKEWQIGVRWDNGRSLFLIYPNDRFKVLS